MTLRKINIGCGFDKRPGYVNVDMDPKTSPDILVEDIEFSNIPRKSFVEVLAYDVLEHIKRAETPGALLEWADLLEMDGVLDLETSNVMAIVDLMRTHESYHMHAGYTVFMFGNQNHPGDFHHTGFTDRTLKVQVLAAGFEIEEFQERGGWLYWLRARKVFDWTAPLDESLSDEQFVVQAWRQALWREAPEIYLNSLVRELGTGRSRRSVLKQLFSSEERRSRTAVKHNL